ncbi:MAG: AarF/UbiB family protein [Desulfobacterales bacterium]|nr:AarF/UbiB family protein [Desulfobacterales bacterium]
MISLRKIGIIGRTYRHFKRYRQILSVFFKYGYGDLIDLLKIEQYIDLGYKLITRKKNDDVRISKLPRAERLRMALEELGPTFIKLGQVLSTRPDLIPVSYIQELAKLQDKVPPVAVSEIKKVFTSEIGRRPEEVFEMFDDVPYASASIGQVHRARLPDGEEVVVKIQRPGIHKTIEVDLEIILHLATLMERYIDEAAVQRPVTIVDEFARTLEKEIDYTIEAGNMERIARYFLSDPTLHVPKVFWEATRSRVLTQEFIDGIKVSDLARLDEAGLDRKVINARGADIIFKQVFDYGFFHADPHPGNIFVLADNVICPVDYGMTGSVDRQTREDFVDLIDGVVHRNEARVSRLILKLTTSDKNPDTRQLENDVADFLGQHLYKPLREIKFGKLLYSLLELLSRHRLRMPPNIFFMLKSLSTVEGVALTLDPDFDMVAKAAPFIERIKLKRYHPKRIAGDVAEFASEMVDFGRQFPKDALDISRLIKEHRLTIKLDHLHLDTLISSLDKISNRISFSIIIAALLIGSALIVLAKTPPLVLGISMIGIIGFFIAAVMGLWLLVAIVKRGRL